jgi:hypothetical protein
MSGSQHLRRRRTVPGLGPRRFSDDSPEGRAPLPGTLLVSRRLGKRPIRLPRTLLVSHRLGRRTATPATAALRSRESPEILRDGLFGCQEGFLASAVSGNGPFACRERFWSAAVSEGGPRRPRRGRRPRRSRPRARPSRESPEILQKGPLACQEGFLAGAVSGNGPFACRQGFVSAGVSGLPRLAPTDASGQPLAKRSGLRVSRAPGSGCRCAGPPGRG